MYQPKIDSKIKVLRKTSYGIFIGPLDDPLYTPAVYAYVD